MIKKNKNAFTLAEILITLAIIGVVAALTISSVVGKYQKQVYYTKFIKMYNSINKALNYASVTHGNYDTWGMSDDDNVNNQIFDQNIAPYLKISKRCDDKNCAFFKNIKYVKYLNGEDYHNYCLMFPTSWYTVILDDGSILSLVSLGSDALQMQFDTNGIKEPNTLGRDVFQMFYRKINGKYLLADYSLINISTLRTSRSQQSSMIEGCSPDKKSGSTCSARLLIEHKMDY